jgi:hypothetical protein
MALLGVLLVIDGASATAATAAGPGRTAEMRRSGCCGAMLPAGCRCCEPAVPGTSTAATAASVPSIGGRATAVATAGPDSPGSTCQCRSHDPAAPIGRDGPRPHDGRGDPAREVAWGLLVLGDILRAPSLSAAAPTVHLPRSPLYLRTARLLI